MLIGGTVIMTKRISCKVVRSVPLGKSSGSPRHPVNSRFKISNFKLSAIGSETAFNVHTRDNHNSVTYTSRAELARLSNGDGPAGQNLDCQA